MPGFAKSGAGGNHRLIADAVSLHSVERNQILPCKARNAPGIRLEIIDQKALSGSCNSLARPRCFDDPGKVRSFDAAIA